MNDNLVYPIPTPGVSDQRLAVDSTAGGVQFSAFNALTREVMFDIQTDAVMCTVDGSAPTSTNGHELPVNTRYTWSKAQAAAAKFIRKTTDAVIHASELTQ